MALNMTPELFPRETMFHWPSHREQLQERDRCGRRPRRAPALQRHVRDRPYHRAGTGEMIGFHRSGLGVKGGEVVDETAAASTFAKPVKNLGVAALGHESRGGLDVAVDNSFRMRGVKRIGDLDGKAQLRRQAVKLHGLAADAVLQCRAEHCRHTHSFSRAELPIKN